MMGRGLFFGGLLMAAAGLPYVSAPSGRTELEATDADSAGLHLQPWLDEREQHEPPHLAAGGPQRTPVIDMADALSYDVTPAWILSRWPRVSTALAELNLHGHRVSWMSGTSADDVAGSLTYYFDRQQRVARIAFQGSTTNPAKLIALVASRFGLRPASSNEAGVHVYETRWNGRAESQLQIRSFGATDLGGGTPSFHVVLSLTNPAAR